MTNKVVQIKPATVPDVNYFMALDAMENLVASIGSDSDKRMFTRYREKYIFSRAELEAMYIENWLAGKIIDVIPDDMTREWRTINTTEKPERVKEFEEFEEDLDVVNKFNESSKWARLYGGCGIILGIQESQGGPMDEPLDIELLGKGAIEHLTVIENERLTYTGAPIIIDPMDPDFGQPEFFRVASTSQTVHRSRILFFNGIPLPYYLRKRQRLAFWGAPVMRRVMEAVSNSDLGVNGVASLMSEASVDVIKYKGLTGFLSQPGGEEKVRARFNLMKLLKSLNNITLLDEEESYESHQQTFAGLSDLIDKYLALVAGAADIPVTRLVGTSAKGLNATGEGDLKNYYDNIRARQRREYNPQLRRLDSIMQRTLWGNEADEWSFTWDSLFQLTEKEIAEMENIRADRDTKHLAAGVIDELIVAGQLYEDGTYTNIDQEYLDKLEKVIEQLKKDQEDMLAQAKVAPGVDPSGNGDEPDDDGPEDLLSM